MARIKEIMFKIDRKISDGDYGSVGLTVGEIVSLDAHDDPEEIREEMKERISKEYRRELKNLRAHLGKKG